MSLYAAESRSPETSNSDCESTIAAGDIPVLCDATILNYRDLVIQRTGWADVHWNRQHHIAGFKTTRIGRYQAHVLFTVNLLNGRRKLRNKHT